MLRKFWNWLTDAAYVEELEVENARLKRRVSGQADTIQLLGEARNHFELQAANERRATNFWWNAAQQGLDTVYEDFVQSKFVKSEGSEGAVHAVLGLGGEAGEVVDIVKKSWVREKPIDREHLIEELGDVIFYWFALCRNQGIRPADVIDANVRKLSERYPPGTSALQAPAVVGGTEPMPVLFAGNEAAA